MATWDWSKLQPFVNAVKTACDAGALGGAKALQEDIQRSFGRHGRYKSAPPGSPPNRRRSSLVNSIQVVLSGPMQAKVGSNLPQARTLEFGRHIAARNSRFLTIPLNEAAARQNEKTGGMRTTPGGVRFFRSRKLNLIAVGGGKVKRPQRKKNSAGQTIHVSPPGQPRWLLKDTVSIAARPFLRPAMARAPGNPNVFAKFARGVNGALARAGFKTKVVRA